MKWNEIEQKLGSQGLVLFTSQGFHRAAGLSAVSAKLLLIRAVKKGLLLKLKARRGLYCFKRKPPHPRLLANRVLRPSYVSLETPLSYYGALPETVYGTASATSKTTRGYESRGQLRFPSPAGRERGLWNPRSRVARYRKGPMISKRPFRGSTPRSFLGN